MDDIFEKNGIYLDDLNKIRVLEEKVSEKGIEVKEKCKSYFEKIAEFQKIADGFIFQITALANEVENEKMKVIGSRNLLKSVAKQREAEQQQLQALLHEKTIELERLGIQLQSLSKTESDQRELIEHLLLHR